MYVTIRHNGEVLAAGSGRNYEATLRRLYRQLGRPGRRLAVDQYFRTDRGFPWGTHHVQFGNRVPTGGVSLDDLITVQVE